MDEATSSPLADYLDSQLFKPWKKNRAPLETKWLDCWNAFRGIVTGKWKADEAVGYRSNSNINYTRQKVQAAFAIILAQVIRGGRIVFNVSADKGNAGLMQLFGVTDEAELSEALDAQANEVRERVDSVFSACDAERAYAKNLLAAAVYGETYAQETTATVETTRWRPVLPRGMEIAPKGMGPQDAAWEPYLESTTGFAWDYVPVWEIVRDLEGDDLQDITGYFRCRPVSPYYVAGLKGLPWMDDAAIDRVLSAAAEKTTAGEQYDATRAGVNPGVARLQHRGNSIDYREYHGRIPAAQAALYEAARIARAGGKAPVVDAVPEEARSSRGDEIEVIVWLCGQEVIGFLREEPGRRPLVRSIWEDALDDIGGQGVADNVRDVHMAMTGAFRAFEDGCKAASALILVLRESLLSNPEDIGKGIRSGFLKLQLKAGPHRLEDAVRQLTLQNPATNVGPLMQELKAFLDEESLLPRISSGLGQDKAATAYEYSQRIERAGTYVAGIIRNQDEMLVEPMVERVIRGFMEDPDWTGPRGTFHAEAQGAAGFEQRFTRITGIYQLLTLVLGSETLMRRAKLDKPLAEIAASLDMRAEDAWRTDSEIEETERDIEARARMMQAESESALAAKAALDRARAEQVRSDAAVSEGGLRVKEASLVADLEDRAMAREAPANGASRPPGGKGVASQK